MTLLANNLSGISSGTVPTTGNSGGSSGNAFDSVSTGSGGTLVVDNTYATDASPVSMKTATGGTAVSNYFGWSTSLGSVGEVWFRTCLYLTSNPPVACVPADFKNSATNCALIKITAAGKVRIDNSAFAEVLISTNSVPLNQWFRIEGWIIPSTTVGQGSFSLYDSVDSTTPTETQTTTAAQNFGASSLNTAFFGDLATQANNGPYWLANVGVSTTGPLGPATVSVSGVPASVGVTAPPGTPQGFALTDIMDATELSGSVKPLTGYIGVASCLTSYSGAVS